MIDLNIHIDTIFRNALLDDKIDYSIKIEGESKVTTLPDLFEIILNQLIENSVIHAFAPEDEAKIHLLVQNVNERIILEYRDNGKGVDVDMKGQIFNPFVTSDPGNEDHTGLGLYRIHNLVTQALNGQIHLLEEPGFALRIEFNL